MISAIKKYTINFNTDKLWLIIVLIYLGLWLFSQSAFLETIGFALSALLSTAPFILFAVLLIGWMKATNSEALIASYFKGQGVGLIILASLIGGLSPFCSCEVIPFVAALLAAGVPLSAIMAFWLASPLMDPAIMTITAGELGWQFALIKMAMAIMIGLFGGFSIKLIYQSRPQFLAQTLKQKTPQGCGCGGEKSDEPIWHFWSHTERRAVFYQETKYNALFLLKWMFFAYTIEALMVAYMPADMIASTLGGDGFLPIIFATILGMPAYLNGYAAPSIVGGLMEQGMSAGAGMAFLMAGGISSIPAMTAVYALVTGRVFALYMAFGFTGALLAGIFMTFL